MTTRNSAPTLIPTSYPELEAETYRALEAAPERQTELPAPSAPASAPSQRVYYRQPANPRNPTEADLALEAYFICQPNGFTAFGCGSVPTDEELKLLGFERVTFRAVQVCPPVCPVNGAEFGDEPYWIRRPFRSDGTALKFG